MENYFGKIHSKIVVGGTSTGTYEKIKFLPN